MSPEEYDKACAFYRELITALSASYPRLMEDNIGIFEVIHAFEDKLPLLHVLMEKNILSGVVLKKSSSEMQPDIAGKMTDMVKSQDLMIARSATTYALSAVFALSARAKQRPFIIADHGGYFSPVLKTLRDVFGAQLVGVTEHTLNGQVRLDSQTGHNFNYLSAARVDLKGRSDRDVAYAIARETAKTAEYFGKPIFSAHHAPTILLIGYGTMGLHAAQFLKRQGSTAEMIVTDIKAKQRAFAMQDGHMVSHDLNSILPRADIIILATDVIKGRTPALTPEHFAMMKKDVLVTSMTSMVDEAAQDELIENRIITHIGQDKEHGIYRGPTGKPLILMQEGRPANVGLPDGGSGPSIYMVQAAGLAAAFILAQNRGQEFLTYDTPTALPDETSEIIASLWMKHFGNTPAPV